ncbi:class I SAM-dependent methyltransferase [Caldicellulosiruptor owensensis]|uniref:class I SAM-dependent methyltransferase n=1 Tax=Caldicellulosiruptor owensensis TaxID=55205 RepID=UPI0002E86711|nr:class I SAM-dependent methyltransferase [Caldicellulosiruptor owensensis]
MNTKEYFDSMASEWDEVTKHDNKKIEAILDLIGIRKCSYIMDVGCGTGILVSYLNKRVGENRKIVCVDISDKMIKIAKNKYRACTNVSFINADVNNLNFRNYFDYIICYSVFPHFEDKKKHALKPY